MLDQRIHVHSEILAAVHGPPVPLLLLDLNNMVGLEVLAVEPRRRVGRGGVARPIKMADGCSSRAAGAVSVIVYFSPIIRACPRPEFVGCRAYSCSCSDVVRRRWFLPSLPHLGHPSRRA